MSHITKPHPEERPAAASGRMGRPRDCPLTTFQTAKLCEQSPLGKVSVIHRECGVVRRSLSIDHQRLWNTGSSAFADDDGECAANSRSHTPPRSRRVKTPELCQQPPSRREGAGNAGCALHPQSRVQKVKSTRGSHHRFTGAARHSPRNGFNVFLRDLPGDRALLSPSSCEYGWSAPGRADFASAKLDASVEAS